jgi:inhibitor of KinA sporulation pathway (predicted exonuclease)
MGKYKVRLDRSLAVDFELTCWQGAPPEGELPEIIQIGITEIDSDTFERTRSGLWYVRNEFSVVSDYCTELTGISQSTLRKQGRSLKEVAGSILKTFGPMNKPWIAWGSDKDAIERDCVAKGVPMFFSEAFYNAGLLYSIASGEGKAVGLAEAARRLGIGFEGREHDAGADADVLAAVWGRMIGNMREFANDYPGAAEPSASQIPRP